MKRKASLIVAPVIVGAVFFSFNPKAAPRVTSEALPVHRDLTLLDQPRGARPAGPVFLGGQAIMSFSEAMLATNHPVFKLCGTVLTPIVCEIRSPCLVIIKSTNIGEMVQYSVNDRRFTGGVKLEVFTGGHPVLDLTADEVTWEN